MREISDVDITSNNNVCAVLNSTWKCLSIYYLECTRNFREMLNFEGFEGLITSTTISAKLWHYSLFERQVYLPQSVVDYDFGIRQGKPPRTLSAQIFTELPSLLTVSWKKKKIENMQIPETHLRSGFINIFAIEALFLIVNIKRPREKAKNFIFILLRLFSVRAKYITSKLQLITTLLIILR